ncbi:unnamed protein product [Fusarium langsethiae]|nr:unnamed protein product [Fusarium langsethiae]
MADITKKWVRHLRTRDRQDRDKGGESQNFVCDIYADEPHTIEAWREHAQIDPEHRSKWPTAQAAGEYVKGITNRPCSQDSSNSRKRRADIGTAEEQAPSGYAADEDRDVDSHRDKRWSPPPARLSPGSPQVTASRSRARNDTRSDCERGPNKNTSGRQLWTEDNPQPKSHSQGRAVPLPSPRKGPPSRMMHQPETRPISQDQAGDQFNSINFALAWRCVDSLLSIWPVELNHRICKLNWWR